jgi:hypothetical protein
MKRHLRATSEGDKIGESSIKGLQYVDAKVTNSKFDFPKQTQPVNLSDYPIAFESQRSKLNYLSDRRIIPSMTFNVASNKIIA